MKPCREFKQRIALSIVEGQNDDAMEEHLLRCTGCRTYAEEIRAVCGDHVHRAAHLPASEAPLRLHGKIRAALPDNPRRWNWARSVAAGALAALTIALYLFWRPAPKPAPIAIMPPPQTQLTEPSYVAYRHRLSRSAEELEAALSREDIGATSPAELLTVSSRVGVLQGPTSP
jgi:hypothetical protein